MVSIIVPVYNVSSYLNRCLNSLLEQTFKEIQVILIDDGSTDDSGKICDSFAKKDSRFRVIHQQNSGLSAARNSGLSLATGEYVIFVDGDDYVEKEYVEKLNLKAADTDSDIVICNYRFVNEAGMEITNDNYSKYSRQDSFDGTEALRLFEDKSFRTFFDVVWNKMYKRTLFEGISFPEGVSVIEDISVQPLLFHRAKRVSVTEDILYNYVYREGSLSHEKRSVQEDIRLRIPMMEKRLNWYKEWNIKELCLAHIIHMNSMYRQLPAYNKELKRIQKEFRSIYKKGNYQGNIGFGRRIKFLIAAISLNFYEKLTVLK